MAGGPDPTAGPALGRLVVEPMTPKDAPAVLAIYGQGIAGGDATLETATPDWAHWNAGHRRDCRFVARLDGRVVGWTAIGTIRGKIVDVPPRVFPELTLQYTSDRAGAECGMGDVGIGPGADGTFELPCQGGHWTIQAGRTIDDIVAEGVVDLAPGGRASVVLRPIAPR